MIISVTENNILRDYSIFEWFSSMSGETSIDDISVMKFNGQIYKFLPENYVIPRYIIYIITKGSISANINNKTYVFSTNEGCLLSPNFAIQNPNPETEYAEMYILTFSKQFAKEIDVDFKLSLVAHIYAQPIWKMSERTVRLTIQYLHLLRDVIQNHNSKAVKTLVNSLFTYLAEEIEFDREIQSPLSREEDITSRFLVLIDKNHEHQHQLGWYASELCVSTGYMADIIKRTIGMTAGACIDKALIQSAKAYLLTTTMSIQEIAEQLCFKNQSHFGTFFKRNTGVSPVAFRKTLLQINDGD